MEHPENREDEVPQVTVEPQAEIVETDRGQQCRYCKKIGNNVVRKTYKVIPGLGIKRTRFCLSCRREFTTFEK